MHQFDLDILYFFNRTLASNALDSFVDIITNVRYWYAIYAIAGLFLIYRYRLRGVAIVIAAIILITATDSLAHYILKPLVDRQRPCAISPSFSSACPELVEGRGQGVVDGEHIVSWIRLPAGMRYDESFPSQHALNNFAMAAFFVLLFKRSKWIHSLWFVALIISCGRLYQGLHYPSDVVGGVIIGVAIGILFAVLFNKLERSKFNILKSRFVETST